MQRIEISRSEFESQYGFKPEPNTIGMVFMTSSGAPVIEYIFSDEDYTPGEVALEIAELERMVGL